MKLFAKYPFTIFLLIALVGFSGFVVVYKHQAKAANRLADIDACALAQLDHDFSSGLKNHPKSCQSKVVIDVRLDMCASLIKSDIRLKNAILKKQAFIKWKLGFRRPSYLYAPQWKGSCPSGKLILLDLTEKLYKR